MEKKKGYSWFRVYREFYTDPKILGMDEKYQARLIRLFCAKCDLETIREKDVPILLRLSASEVAETKAVFLENGFIDDSWAVLNWDKRQFEGDHSKDRTKNWRDRKKSVTSRERHGDSHGDRSVTREDTDTEYATKKDYGF